MDRLGLIVAAFLALLSFLVMVLQYELDLSLVVATLLAVSVASVGLLVAVGLRSVAGLGVLQTVLGLGALMFAVTGLYELVS